MNLDELRSVQNAERRQSDLQSLRESFYAEAGEYVASLKQQRARTAERASDPFSDPEVGRLTDEIETAEEVIEAIYERRMGKLLDRASLAAADMSVDEDGLTAEERELFHDLVERIRQNKSTVLDTVAGENGDDGPGAATDEAPDATGRENPTGDGVSAADVMAGDGSGTTGGNSTSAGDRAPGEETTPEHHAVDPDPEPPGRRPAGSRETATGAGDRSGTPDVGTEQSDDRRSDGPDTRRSSDGGDARGSADPGIDLQERVTVQITEEVGEIFGVDDREYDLAADDVVQLPERNAIPLVERDAAERLD